MSNYAVSIVVPVFNEGGLIDKTVAVLNDTAASLNCEYELIFVNDGSRDETEDKLNAAEHIYESVRALNFSRNFGKEAAMVAGLEAAEGDCVIFIDGDLQHPPALIPKLVDRWLAGVDVVNARKRDRGTESLAYKMSAGLFNASMSQALGTDFSGASDYKLLDRQVVDAILQCEERNRFFRGLVTWVGFTTEDVYFDVEEREEGESKFNTIGMLKYSLNTMLAFTSLPLRMVAYLGFVTSGIGVLLLLQTLVNYLMGSAAVGFTTVIAVQILLGGMMLSSMGVIALYVAKIYQEQKSRPLYIIRKHTKPRGALREAAQPVPQSKSAA